MEKKQRTDGKHVKSLIDDLLGRIEKAAQKKGTPTKEAWERINNEELKKHARVINVKRGVLMVKVDTSAMLYDLTIKKRDIIKEFNEGYESKKKITDIMFRVGSLEE
ncbi:MAG: DUF721 domain-containing protein [Candidatus Aadella gelida]|nr:DUF721 domain-containing protein [Candidatus Aadella gelida]